MDQAYQVILDREVFQGHLEWKVLKEKLHLLDQVRKVKKVNLVSMVAMDFLVIQVLMDW